MNLKLKTLALAAAMTAATAAHADFVSGAVPGTTGDSTLGLLVWNTQTNSYYLRDLGYTLNSFLPNNGAAITGSAELTPVFDKTPEAGLTIDKTSSANFADSAFTTWLGSQDQSLIRWTVMAADRLGTSASNNFRQIVSVVSGSAITNITGGVISNGTAGINGFASTFAGISTTGSLSAAQIASATGDFLNISGLTNALGGVADLYYWVRSGTALSTPAFQDQFGNTQHFATLSLASNGDLTYTLAAADVAAVPLPAAGWLLGSGLLGIGGMVRRRKAAEA